MDFKELFIVKIEDNSHGMHRDLFESSLDRKRHRI